MRMIPDLSETKGLCPPQIHTLNSNPQCDVGPLEGDQSLRRSPHE